MGYLRTLVEGSRLRKPLREAIRFYNAGRFEEAVELLEPLQKEKAHRKLVAFYLGEACRALGDNYWWRGEGEEAIAAYRRVLVLCPSYADVWLHLARIYKLKGWPGKSREAVGEALKLNTHYFEARVESGFLYCRERDYSRALQEFHRATETTSFFVPSHYDYGVAMFRRRKYRQGMAAFAAAFRTKPDRVKLLCTLASESLRGGEVDQAIADYKAAVAVRPKYADLHNLLGLAFHEKGTLGNALREFRRAIRLSPRYLKARLNLAFCLVELRRLGEARAELRRVLDLDPDQPMARELFGRLMEKA